MANTTPTTGCSSDAAHADRGIFITFEGGEGAGKTTHIHFLADTLREHGRDVLCLREPGGTSIGEQLRSIVLDPANIQLADETELLIYEAARAQIMVEVIRPALEQGTVVLCDRFADSTVAYQAYGRGLSREFVDQVNDFVCQGIQPDRTILLVAGDSVSTGLSRATRKNGADRLELAGEEFHTRVNEAFLQIAHDNPQRVRMVVSSGKRSETSRAIFAELYDLFPWMDCEQLRDISYFAQLDERHAKANSESMQAQ